MKDQDSIVISKLRQITIISLIFMTLQFLGGFYAHSIAIFADAFHLLSDVSAYIISLYAVHKSYQRSPRNLTFGYEKVQPLGALLNVAIIWVVTVELFMQATERIFHLAVVEEPLIMLATSVFGLLCNLYIMRILHSDEHAGGHHGCSHSHHGSHNHDSVTQQEQHHHGHDCQHEHRHQHQEHQHNHLCQHQHHQHNHPHDEHNSHDDRNQHHHEEHTNDLSPHHLHSHSPKCTHAHHHAEGGPNCGDSESHHRKMSDELIPSHEQIHSHEILPHAYQQEAHSAPRFHNNINIEAAYIHILTDIILSIGVILSASIIYFFAPEGHIWTYWQLADPLCTYLFSFMAIYSTLPIVKESLLFLLDGCTDDKLLAEIEHQIKENQAVLSVENLKVWSTNRGKHYGALRVRVKPEKIGLDELRRVFSSRGVEGFVELVEAECGEEGKE